jgi:hypothetical protein
LIADTLAARGPLFRRALVSRVAHRAELGHDLDMLWAAARLSSDVTRALDAVRGVLWELETAA